MAFFKFPWLGRSSVEDKPGRRARAPQAESVEVMRRRARHRLIGAAVLVGVGVIGFPLVFDTQPRPVAVDVPIEIPDRHKAPPLPMPEAAKPAQAAAPMASAATTPRPSGIADGEEVLAPRATTPSRPSAAPVPATAAESAPVREARASEPPKPSPPARPADDGARARALLEGRPSDAVGAGAMAASAEEGRFIVQVGAFADADKVKEVRARLERAGLKTYTHAIDTKDGKRIRVRVGPFANRAEADRAAARVKALDLPASVLTL